MAYEADKENELIAIEQIRSCGFEPQKIGQGTYGTVFAVKDFEGSVFALKYIKRQPELYRLVGFDSLLEIDILRRLKHPHIIHSPTVITSITCDLRNSLGVIMPLADMTLSTAIEKKTLTIDAKLRIMYKLSTALDFMHKCNILHLDIKNVNIVLRQMEPYLIDFGLASIVSDVNTGRYYANELVTVTNRPPEILKGERMYNGAVDIWSMGMVMLSLLSNKAILFPVDINWESKEQVLRQLQLIVTQLPALLKDVNIKYRDQCISLLQSMLNYDPKQRPTAMQVKEHSLFNDVASLVVGFIDNQVYTPIYNNDHRNILKLIIFWAKELFANNSAQSLLLAIDIYNRAGVFYTQASSLEYMSMAAACLYVSMKLLDEPYPDTITYLETINKLVPDMTVDELLKGEVEIIYYLEGILYRSPFFDKLETGDELMLTFSHIIMDRDSTLYLRVDYDAWSRTIKQIPSPNKYPSKGITIKQLLSTE